MELLADRDPEEARKLLDPVLERMMEASAGTATAGIGSAPGPARLAPGGPPFTPPLGGTRKERDSEERTVGGRSRLPRPAEVG